MFRPAHFLIAALASLALSACVSNRTLGEGIDDSAADFAVKRQLLADRKHNYSDIDIAIFEGRLMLTGTVKTPEARASLTEKAERVVTVHEVLNEVIVGSRTPFRQGAMDALIDEKLGAAIVTDNGIFSGNYQIVVSNGTVYVLGVAQGPEELSRMTGHAQTIDGVRNVVSHVIFVGDPRRQRG